MFASILINNFNYAPFLKEAIDSACAQTWRDLEIIVVDDGSTDGSQELIERLAATDARIVPHFKANGGQLSAINAGIARARGDVLFFLDADDLYAPDHVDKALTVYAEHPECDFLFCSYQQFGVANERVGLPCPDRLTDLGFTALLTFLSPTWIGAATSALSLRSTLAERFCPMANEHDWRVRADDCLVMLASLHMGRKFYLDEPLVSYRTHANNRHFGKSRDPGSDYVHKMRQSRLIGEATERTGLYRHLGGKHLLDLLHGEACTGRKHSALLRDYRRVMKQQGDVPLLTRLKALRRVSRMIRDAD